MRRVLSILLLVSSLGMAAPVKGGDTKKPATKSTEIRKAEPVQEEPKAPPKPNTSFTLNLKPYNPGDLPEDTIGKNLVVMIDGGRKYLRGRTDDGEISFKINLPGTWETSLTVPLTGGKFSFGISDDQGTNQTVYLDGNDQLLFGAEKQSWLLLKSWQHRKLNTITLRCDGKTVKCLINDQVFASVPSDASKTYTRVDVKGITQKTRITGLRGDER